MGRRAAASLRQAIVDAPLLAFLDYSQPIVLRTDASTVGLGGVLLQRIDGVERPVRFISHRWSPTAARWSTIEQELYAVVYCIQQCDTELRHAKFVV